MKTLFTIGTDNSNSETLLLELGQDHCCYAFLNRASKTFSKISYNALEEFEDTAGLSDLLQNLHIEQLESVVVCSAHAKALLIPQQYFTTDYFFPGLVDELPGHQLNDMIPEWQLVASYAIPSYLFEIVNAKLPPPVYFHAYTPTLKIYNGFTASDQVDIHFTTQFFRVLVKKGKQIHLAQTYPYKTPLDVVYFLLKIFHEFNLNQSAVFLIISGLIDKDSALFLELHHYFLNLHFAHSPAYMIPESDLPAYYFNSLYNLASCVS